MPINIYIRVAIYARVSTSDQNCEMQLGELRGYCQRRGWTIVDEYIDAIWRATRASRPELKRLLWDAAQHKFDAVCVEVGSVRQQRSQPL